MNTEKELTGYPSIDKPWLKYYPDSLADKPLPQKSLYKYIYEANKDHKTNYAFNYFGKRITYGQLFYEIDRCAKALLRLGVKAGDIVTIMGLASPETFYCAYACSKIGAVINLISVLAGEQELVHYLNEAKSKVFIALDLFNDKIIKALPQTSVKTVVNLSLDTSMPLHIRTVYKLKAKVLKCKGFMPWKAFVALAEGQPPVRVFKYMPNRFSYLAHTGGTTGNPKGVMLCDDKINGIVEEDIHNFHYKRQLRFLNTIPPFYSYGFICNAHILLSQGFEIFLLPKVDTNKIPQIIIKERINVICSAPQFLVKLQNNSLLKKTDMSFLINLACGGDGLTPEMEKRINYSVYPNKIISGYGLTEICAMACGNIKKIVPGSVGQPLSRNVVSIFDTIKCKELSYNQIGEICFLSPYKMLGYYKNINETNNVFRMHDDGNTWFHTGDLGYMTEDGVLFITGRIKRILLTIYNGLGHKIFPDNIEIVLNKHYAVEKSCIVKQHNNTTNIKLTAYIVLKEQSFNSTGKIEKQLRELCKSDLPEYSLPSKYVFIDSMPLTAAGKVDFRTLEKMAETNT